MNKRDTNHMLDELRWQLAACPLFDRRSLDTDGGAWIRADGLDDVSCAVLELDIRPRKALQRLKIETVGELLRTSSTQLMAQRNLSDVSLRHMRQRVVWYLCRQRNLPLPPLSHRDRLVAEKARKRKARAQRALALFNALGSYAAVGHRLHISRERVRQILEEGGRQQWIDWEPPRRSLSKQRRALRQEWSPETLRRALLKLGSIERVRVKYHLKQTEIAYQNTCPARYDQSRYYVEPAVMWRSGRPGARRALSCRVRAPSDST